MRKFLALYLACLMGLMSAAPAFADEVEQATQQTTVAEEVSEDPTKNKAIMGMGEFADAPAEEISEEATEEAAEESADSVEEIAEEVIEEETEAEEVISEEEILLTKLGVLDMDAKESITTRAGFVVYLLKLLQVPVQATGDEVSVFSDVMAYVAEINKAYEMGIISNAGGAFRPDDAITLSEATVMFSNLLGYASTAEIYGGYPQGFLKVASENGLFRGLNQRAEELSYQDICVLFTNAMKAEMISVDFEDGNMISKTQEDVTLMSHYADIYYAEGILEKNEYTSILPEDYKQMIPGEVLIDGISYHVGSTDATELIGRKLKFYYHEEKDERTLLALSDHRHTEVLVVPDSDIEPGNSADEVTFEWNERQDKTVRFTDETVVIKNHRRCIDLTAADLRPEIGELRFIDNDGDGKYEVVIIENYELAVVQNVSESKQQIIDEISGKVYQLEDYEAVKIYDKIGNEIALSDIYAKNTLTIMADPEMAFFIVYRDVARISGIVGGISDEEITIDGKTYELSGMFERLVENLPETAAKPKNGDMILVYLDRNGRAAYFDLSWNVGRHGLLISSALLEEEDRENVYQLVIMDKEEGKVKLKTAKKVKIDGEGYTGDGLGSALNNLIDARCYSVCMPILYKVNKQREIKEIDSAIFDQEHEKQDSSLQPLRENQRMLYQNEGHIAMTYYDSNQHNGFLIGNGSYWVRLPINPIDYEEYVLRNVDLESGVSPYVYAYAIGNSRIAEFVLEQPAAIDDAPYSPGQNDSLAVVKRVYDTVDADDEVVQYVVVFYGGKEQEYKAKEYGMFSELQKGDIIYFDVNDKMEIDRLSTPVSCDAPMISGAFSSNERAVGKICYKEDSLVGLDVNNVWQSEADNDNLAYFNLATSSTIYIYNRETEEIRLGQRSDIISEHNAKGLGMDMFIQARYGEIRGVVLFE
ncbi:MAG: S-layer homology domain-containing protein [Ruminococcaceae bacterium]|nr:S-layer homology domain-containing protein [Oscillospiraceae bacterium]